MMASIDEPNEVAAAQDWLSINRDALTAVNEGGCGCCVRVWQVEGPEDVLETIPYVVSASSDWDTD